MEHDLYQIGQLAKLANVNIQTIRYYERINLLKPKIRKNKNGARLYSKECFNTLSFIKNAQLIGFQLDEIKELLKLRTESEGRCQKVRSSVENKLQEVQDKIKQYKTLEKSLKSLIKTCSTKSTDKVCTIMKELEV